MTLRIIKVDDVDISLRYIDQDYCSLLNGRELTLKFSFLAEKSAYKFSFLLLKEMDDFLSDITDEMIESKLFET